MKYNTTELVDPEPYVPCYVNLFHLNLLDLLIFYSYSKSPNMKSVHSQEGN